LLHHAHFNMKGGEQTFAALRIEVCCADKADVRHGFEPVEILGLDRRNGAGIVAHFIPTRGTYGLGTRQGLSRHSVSNGHKTCPVEETLPAFISQMDTKVDGAAEPRYGGGE
jgi:hypothetical protein